MPALPRLSRAAIAAACSLSLSLPAVARAQEPGGAEDSLNPQAEQHVEKALTAFKSGAYVNAEEEFKRAAFFSPNWRPLHFNMGVLAEAQGKLGTAIHEYEQFKPLATPDEALVVDQRIFELSDRRRRIAGTYKRQIAIGATALTLGLAALGGTAGLIVYNRSLKQDVEDLNERNDELEGVNPSDPQIAINDKKIESLEAKQKNVLYGEIVLATVGLVIVLYSVLPLMRSVKAKRQLDGIALGPTRLKWNGGAGVVLRF
jgi:tetratricopeptide (TPR) repeat protein